MTQSENRRITVSDLLRNAGALFDDVEVDRVSFVIHRYGVPVAHLTPAEVTARRRRARRKAVDVTPPQKPPETAVDPEVLATDLEEDGKLVLTFIAEKGSAGCYEGELDGLLPGPRMATALGLLELARLIRNERMWYWPTEAGAEHARG